MSSTQRGQMKRARRDSVDSPSPNSDSGYETGIMSSPITKGASHTQAPRVRARMAVPRTKRRRIEDEDEELQKGASTNSQRKLRNRHRVFDAERDKELAALKAENEKLKTKNKEFTTKNEALRTEIEELNTDSEEFRTKIEQMEFIIYTRENDVRRLELEAAKDKEFIGARITFYADSDARVVQSTKEADAAKAKAEKAERDSDERFRDLREKFHLAEYQLGEANKTLSTLQDQHAASTDRAEAEDMIKRLAVVADGYRQSLVECPDSFADSIYQAFVQRTGWTDADTKTWFSATCESIKNRYLSTRLPTLDASLQPVVDLINSTLPPAQYPQTQYFDAYDLSSASYLPSTDFLDAAQHWAPNDGADYQTSPADNTYTSGLGLQDDDTLLLQDMAAIPVPAASVPVIPASLIFLTPQESTSANPTGPPPDQTEASSPSSKQDPWSWAYTVPTDQASWKIFKENCKVIKVSYVPPKMPTDAVTIAGYMAQAQSKVEFKHGPRPGALERLLDVAF